MWGKAAIPKLADHILKAVREQRLDNQLLQNSHSPEPQTKVPDHPG